MLSLFSRIFTRGELVKYRNWQFDTFPEGRDIHPREYVHPSAIQSEWPLAGPQGRFLQCSFDCAQSPVWKLGGDLYNMSSQQPIALHFVIIWHLFANSSTRQIRFQAKDQWYLQSLIDTKRDVVERSIFQTFHVTTLLTLARAVFSTQLGIVSVPYTSATGQKMHLRPDLILTFFRLLTFHSYCRWKKLCTHLFYDRSLDEHWGRWN